MLKKFVFFIILIVLSNFTFSLSAEIIPLKKPIQSKEEKEKKLLVDVLKPLPKPIIVKEIKKKEEQTEKKNCFKKREPSRFHFAQKKTFNCRIKKNRLSKKI